MSSKNFFRDVDRRVVVAALTCAAMIAFAFNSFLTRLAFQTTAIDAGSFTTIRLITGAFTLAVILWRQGGSLHLNMRNAIAAVLLFVYAAAFSFAYRQISTGAGALVLFAAAQLLMISYGWLRGERTNVWALLLACAGMVIFLVPSASAPPLTAAVLMAVAGFAWGGFSLIGKSTDSPVGATATSFVFTVPLAILLMSVQVEHIRLDWAGGIYASLSGALASAVGYAVWYWVRVRMSAISAGAVQLSVPVISATLGALFLDERLALRSVVSGLIVLCGIAWVTLSVRKLEPDRISTPTEH